MNQIKNHKKKQIKQIIKINFIIILTQNMNKKIPLTIISDIHSFVKSISPAISPTKNLKVKFNYSTPCSPKTSAQKSLFKTNRVLDSTQREFKSKNFLKSLIQKKRNIQKAQISEKMNLIQAAVYQINQTTEPELQNAYKSDQQITLNEPIELQDHNSNFLQKIIKMKIQSRLKALMNPIDEICLISFDQSESILNNCNRNDQSKKSISKQVAVQTESYTHQTKQNNKLMKKPISLKQKYKRLNYKIYLQKRQNQIKLLQNVKSKCRIINKY